MFALPSNYAYIFLTLPFLIVWLVLYLAKISTRREQLLMSYIGAVVGPLSEIVYFRDYWIPHSIFSIQIGNFPLMIEDILFGFAIGGIGAVIFEVVFRTKLKRLSIHSNRIAKSLSILVVLSATLFICLYFGINSIYASSMAFIVASILILFFRHDLFLNAIGSGVCVMLVMFVSYFILFHLVSNTDSLMRQQWLLYGTPLDLRFLGIPLTEMVWGFTWGFLAGPLYEFITNERNVWKAN